MRRIGLVIAASVAAVKMSLAVGAGFLPGAVAIDLRIDAQPLDTALNSWASQTGYSVLVPVEPGVGGQMARSVIGTYTAEYALRELLAGSQFEYDLVNTRTVAIRVAAASDLARDRTGGSARGSAVDRNRELDTPGSDAGRNRAEVTAPEAKKNAVASDSASRGIPEVLVTGARSMNSDIRRSRDGAQPYVVFDKSTIERSGAQNLDEFLKSRLTMATQSVSNNQINAGLVTSSVNLRGLGTDETLILIDGRRASGSFSSGGVASQPDINGIPLAGIERIEILPATASGIYGGSATGGVVNIIMRRDFKGLETKLTYGDVVDGAAAARRVDLSGGTSLRHGRTTMSMAASWSDADTLLTGDRDFALRARDQVLALRGYGALGLPVGATTNIVAQGNANLTLAGSNQPLNSPRTSVPYGYAGPGSDGGAALVANAGTYNLDLPNTAEPIGLGGQGARGSLLAAPTVVSFTGTVRNQFSDRIEAFTEFTTSNTQGRFDRTSSIATFTIPAGAAGNPFNQAISVVTPAVGVLGDVSTSNLHSVRAILGATAKLSPTWSMSLDYTWNQTKSDRRAAARLDSGAIAAAARTGSLNLFKDTNAFAVDYSPYILPDIVTTPNRDTLGDATARIAGALPFSLPGGEPSLSFLAEYRSERVGDQYTVAPVSLSFTSRVLFPHTSLGVTSLYLESLLPIVGERNAVPGLQLLEVQIAGRHDSYRTDGASGVSVDANLVPLQTIERNVNRVSSTDPTVGLRYKPIADITLRGSFGTGFSPPTAGQLTAVLLPSFNGSATNLTDPLRGNERLGVIDVTRGGNPNLEPENSKSWSAGIIVTPEAAPGLRVSADWTTIKKNNNIISPNITGGGQGNFESVIEFAPQRIIRGAPSGGFAVGPIVGINESFLNIAKLKVEALDLAVDMRTETERLGSFEFNAMATRLIALETQIFENSPRLDNVGVGPAVNIGGAGTGGGGLVWRGSAVLTWSYRQWTLGWDTRFFDSYYLNLSHAVDPNQGSATVPSQAYNDFFGSYRFQPLAAPRLFADTEITFGINNVFNKAPPLDVVGTGSNSPGYSLFGDPRRANYYLAIRKSFGR